MPPEQESRVRHREGGEHDHVCGLLVFGARDHIDIAHPGDTLGILVVFDAGHPALHANLEILSLCKHRIEQHLRRRLGLRFADELLAVAAILALRELHAVRVGVGAGRIARWCDKCLVAELVTRGLEDQPGFGRLDGRLGIFVAARCFERIAAGHDRALDVAGLARDSVEFLEQMVVGLHLGVGYAPVLNQQFRRNGFRAVTALKAGSQRRIVLRPAPGKPVPVARSTPSPSPGRNAASRRAGSASSFDEWRTV